MKRLLLAAAFGAFILAPTWVDARAGGGNSYSGGSRSSSSSSSSRSYSSSGSRSYSSSGSRTSGGGGGGSAAGALCPLIFLGGIVWLLTAAARNAKKNGYAQVAARDFQLRNPTPSQLQINAWVADLQRADPNFSLLAFNSRVRQLFLKVQEAWFLRDLAPARPFLSDATFRRFRVQLELMQQQGIRNAIADTKVTGVELVGCSQLDGFDCAQVRISASMRDVNVQAGQSDASAREAASRAPAQTFAEIWSFVRRRGVTTDATRTVAAGKCPNCGAWFNGGESNACGFCQAIVNSGQHDWVLAEITQDVEFRSRAAVPGLEAMRAADPAISLDVLEDRATLLFFKWLEAQARGEPRRLSKVAAPTFVGHIDAHLRAVRERGLRRTLADAAIGGANTLCFSEAADGRIAAHVEILWSARLADVRRPEELSEHPNAPRRHVLVMERARAATSRRERGMSTDRCSGCSAPLGDGEAPSCDFCGVALNDGARDWVLTGFSSWETWASQRPAALQTTTTTVAAAEALQHAAASGDVAAAEPVRAQVRAEVRSEGGFDVRDRERILLLLAATASGDERVSPAERKLLRDFATMWNVGWVNIDLALAKRGALDTGGVSPGSPEAAVVLTWMVQMAKSDGEVDRRERAMLETVAARLQLKPRLTQLLQA